MLPVHLISRNRQYRAYLDRVRAVGANSPATALPRDRLPPLGEGEFRYLVERGDLREGAPGRFYLFERPFSSRKRRLVVVLVLWLLLFILPLILIQLSE